MAQHTDGTIRTKVIYQIFTRNYKEGTFRAVEKDLARIKALGTDIVYLLPVQPSGVVHRKGSLGSPYAISDYRAVDPAQGTMEDFIRLTDAVHAAGMQIILDVVYNHTSPDSWLAKNHPEWFYHKADGSFGNRIGDWWDVIDLDYSNRELWEYQIDTLKMWAEHVDGFRCGVAPLLPLDFWKEAREKVEEVRPGCLWLAEAVEHGFITTCRKRGIPVLSDSELYQVFDICYDYDVYHYQAGAMTGVNTLNDYLLRVNMQEAIYPDNYSKLRCLENHDRPRAAALVPDERIRRNWTAWNYFLKGTAMIYAGQEYSAVHHPTLFDPDPVIELEEGAQEEGDLSALMARLSEIRKHPVFEHSSFSAVSCGKNGEIILAVHEAYADTDQAGMKVYGVFSTTGRAQGLQIDLPDGVYPEAISGKTADVFEHTLAYNGEPMIFFVKDE